MKSQIISCNRICFVVLLVLCTRLTMFSQETDTIVKKRPGMFIAAGYGQSLFHILNQGNNSVSELITHKRKSFSGSFDIGYFFTNSFGLSTGVGYSSFRTQITLETYENTGNAIDSENEPYELRVSGSGITEDQEIEYINVPLYFIFRIPFSKNFGLYIQPGVNVAFPESGNYNSTGRLTYKGYYASDNVLLEDLPAYGFPTDLTVRSEGKLELNKIVYNVIGSAGFDILIRKKFQISAGAVYSRSISNMSENSAPESFRLSQNPGQVKSMMGGCRKVNSEAYGVQVSLRYYLFRGR